MKKELKKTSERVRELSNKVITTGNLEDAGKKVGKLSEEVIKVFDRDKRKLTLGQRAADMLTKWAGSWIFILSFLLFLICWMILNTYFWINYMQGNPFDPYPFILLNLILSCLAAIQAPIILMSQNRTSQRDRLRAEYDYQVNRKAEKEIQNLKKQLNRIERKFK